jgi:hypothetical protein
VVQSLPVYVKTFIFPAKLFKYILHCKSNIIIILSGDVIGSLNMSEVFWVRSGLAVNSLAIPTLLENCLGKWKLLKLLH